MPDSEGLPRGWYDDPDDPTQQRFWSGSEWAFVWRPAEDDPPSASPPSEKELFERLNLGLISEADYIDQLRSLKGLPPMERTSRPTADVESVAVLEAKEKYPVWLLGGGVVVGSLLPWARAGIFTISGTDGDGVITLVLGVLMAVSVAAESRITAGLAMALFSFFALWVSLGVFNRLDVETVGGGLFLVIISSGLGILSGLSLLFRRRRPT